MSNPKSKKMSAKPSSANLTSIEAFIAGADPTTEAPQLAPEGRKDQNRPQVPKRAKRAVGKPPVAPEKVRSKTVQVTLTESELETLKQQAGRVPVSVFLRDMMKDRGII